MPNFLRLLHLLSSLKNPLRRRSTRHCGSVVSAEPLECRALLAFDFGDAPDKTKSALKGDYQTTQSNLGPSHLIDDTQLTMFLGGRVDADSGTLHGLDATADDRTGSDASGRPGQNDEESILYAADLQATVGAAPVVRVRATNLTGSDATLAAWLDINRNGIFENDVERIVATVGQGTNSEQVSLTFPQLPYGAAGVTYLRLRLSSDPAALNSTGPANNGEVEDHRFVVLNKFQKQTSVLRVVTVGDRVGGGPDIGYFDAYGWDSVPIGDLDRDGVSDLVVSAPADGALSTGAIYVLMMNTAGTVKSYKKIASGLNGGPLLSQDDFFGNRLTAIGDVDGDGISDIAVGASGDDTGGRDRGAVYIIQLTSTGTARKVTKIASGLNGGPVVPDDSEFSSVESVGDINHDGRPDLLAGAPFLKDTGRTTTGALFLLSLNADGTSQSSNRLSITETDSKKYANLGEELAFLGDINGDGTVEFASLSHELVGGESMGRYVDIMSLTSEGVVSPLTRLTAWQLGANWLEIGMVSAVGDVNGDGIMDLGYNAVDVNYRTEGFIAFATLNAQGGVAGILKVPKYSGPRTFQDSLYFYASISPLGDLNNDGSPEFVFGMPGFTVDLVNLRLMGGMSVVSIRGDLPKTSRPGVPSPSVSVTASTGETVFRWAAVSTARSYEIWLRDEATGEVLTKIVDAEALLYKPSSILSLGNHTFKIRAVNELGTSNWSATKTIKVTPPATLKTVPDQFGRRPKLSWLPLPGADQYSVRVYDRKSGKLLETASLSASTTSFVPTMDLPSGEYEFQVMGISKNGIQSQWSPKQKFRTEIGITGGVYEIPVRPQRTIWFTALADAATYEIQLVTTNTGTVVRSTSVTSTTYVPDADVPAGSYLVKVKPVAADGSAGSWSSISTFIVPPGPTITLYPAQVDLKLDRELHFAWTKYPAAPFYSVRFHMIGEPEHVFVEQIESLERYYFRRALNPDVLNRFGQYEVSVAPVVNVAGKWVQIGRRSESVLVTVRTSVTGVAINADIGRIKWSADSGAAQYQVNIVKVVNGAEAIVVDETVSTNETRLTQTLPLGAYRLRVRAITASGITGSWSTDVEFVGNERVKLINPDSRWILRTPTLEWQLIPGASSYDITIRHGNVIVMEYQNLQGSSVTPPYLPSMESYSAQYFEWGVSANYGGRKSGVWSEFGKLQIGVAPDNISVAATATGHRITWSKLIDVGYYEVYITDPANKTIGQWGAIRSPELSVSVMQPGVTYRIWVRALAYNGTLTRWVGLTYQY